MKSLFLILYILNAQVQTETLNPGTAAAAGQSLKIVLANHLTRTEHTDEVLIILDKADHTGAGVVIKKCFLKNGNTIVLKGIPEGRYIATIKFVGLHSDNIECSLRVHKKKNNILTVKLQDCEVFAKNQVIIPAEKVNFSKLSVTSKR